jgi:hypothetical protein
VPIPSDDEDLDLSDASPGGKERGGSVSGTGGGFPAHMMLSTSFPYEPLYPIMSAAVQAELGVSQLNDIEEAHTQSVVTLLLHCSYTVVVLLLHCCYTHTGARPEPVTRRTDARSLVQYYIRYL